MSVPPKIYPMEMERLLLPRKVILSNGVPLYIIECGAPEVVRVDFLFKGGYSVQQQPLQALFTNRMLREGSVHLSSKNISLQLDYSGAWIELYSSQGYNHITLHSLKKHFKYLVKMLESMIKEPLFPQNKLDIVRNGNKSYFQVSNRKVGNVAQRHIEQMFWGVNHPLGHIVCAQDYDAINRECLQCYHAGVYKSDTLSIFLSGSIDDDLIADVGKNFGIGKWGSDSCFPTKELPPPTSIFGRRKVEMPDVMQSGVKLGCMIMDSGHPDFLKFRFLMVLFGGYFGSRLMSNIRERNGYTYHIEAGIEEYGVKNAFVVSSETANEYVTPLIKEVYSEMALLREQLVGEEELSLVRNYTFGELCREYEGMSAKAEAFINVWLSGLSFEFVNEYLDVVRSVSSEELQEIARKYLLPENMSEVVVAP